MKKRKGILSLLAAALLVLLPGTNTLTAQAAEPTTYYIQSMDGEWRFQPSAQWDDSAVHRELYYMEQDIKDGDIVIVEGSLDNSPITIPARLSNLTVKSSDSLVITANGIDSCYILGNSTAAVNGDVTTAYVYGSAACNFNNNVTNLEVIGSGSDLNNLNATVAVVGTLSHLKASDSGDGGIYFEYYNFPAGKFYMEYGTVKTEEQYYSKAPSGTQQTAPAGQQASQQTASQSKQPSTASPSGEYDDVPKTGESSLIFWLTGLAAVCLLASFTVRRAR